MGSLLGPVLAEIIMVELKNFIVTKLNSHFGAFRNVMSMILWQLLKKGQSCTSTIKFFPSQHTVYF